MQAVILAGGKGTRLKPFTVVYPKPLMPINDVPILEIVLRQLKYYGFDDIVIAVNHLAELIMAFFGDGKKLGLHISYSVEENALGTAGPLSLIKNLDDTFLMMNGDLLTTLNYQQLFNQHLSNRNDATISVYKKEIKIDLGVLKTNGLIFEDYIEKPTYTFDVSMGVYILNKQMVQFIPHNSKFDLPDLMLELKKNGKKVECFKNDCYWLDIGRVDDYEIAVDVFNKRKTEFLPNG